jgi:hypothetical protein
MTRERLLYDVLTHARLENDYYTTTVRCAHTHTTHTYTHIHTTHTTHTHTHTHTHTTQEAANYVAAEVRRAARSGELRSCGPKVTGGKGSGGCLYGGCI